MNESPDELRTIHSAISAITLQGARYPEHLQRLVGAKAASFMQYIHGSPE
jgi:hypothetical protein